MVAAKTCGEVGSIENDMNYLSNIETITGTLSVTYTGRTYEEPIKSLNFLRSLKTIENRHRNVWAMMIYGVRIFEEVTVNSQQI